MRFVDTHCHLDGEEFRDDLEAVVARAREAGVGAIGIPGIDLASCDTVMAMCRRYPGYCYPMLGLHPEEVKADWQTVLAQIKPRLSEPQVVAIGEVGLDFYWSREFEQAQLAAFEEQVKWSVEYRLPLMIHCRKAQHELVAILKRYQNDLPGGVFHCFTGNEQEAKELLQFERFVLGIGGVLTFKKSHLPEVLPACVPLDRIVLETDAPYMAPVPMRGQRNEPAFVAHVLQRLAEAYGVDAILALGGNVYVTLGYTHHYLEKGSTPSGFRYDEVLYLDMIAKDLQNAAVSLLADNPDRMPQTDDASAQFMNAFSAVLIGYTNRGILATAPWKMPAIGNLRTGDYLENGFALWADSYDNQSEADRAAHKAVPIQVALALANSLESMVINVNVQL